MSERARKLTPEEVEEMQRLRDEGVKLKDIAKDFDVCTNTVHERTIPREDPNWRKKANWPEWKLWENLHRRYGKRQQEGKLK